MRIGKKGDAKVTVVIILAVVIGVIALVIAIVLQQGTESAIVQKMCTASCAWDLDTMAEHFCQPITYAREDGIVPDNWEKCNVSFKEVDDPNGCLAEQIAKLMNKCWVKFGSGLLDCTETFEYETVCYHVDILPPTDKKYLGKIKVSKGELIDVMSLIKADESKYYIDYILAESFELESKKYVEPLQKWDIIFIDDSDLVPAIWNLPGGKDWLALSYSLPYAFSCGNACTDAKKNAKDCDVDWRNLYCNAVYNTKLTCGKAQSPPNNLIPLCEHNLNGVQCTC